MVFIKEPSSQDALQGRRALLRCEVEAPGPVHVYWLLNGVPVQDTERRFAQGSSLSFAAVDRLQDSGAFQCVARDDMTGEEALSANATFNIKCESPRSCLVPCQTLHCRAIWSPALSQLHPLPIE
jgi:PTK7 protein tyrosine kinase 7